MNLAKIQEMMHITNSHDVMGIHCNNSRILNMYSHIVFGSRSNRLARLLGKQFISRLISAVSGQNMRTCMSFWTTPQRQRRDSGGVLVQRPFSLVKLCELSLSLVNAIRYISFTSQAAYIRLLSRNGFKSLYATLRLLFDA